MKTFVVALFFIAGSILPSHNATAQNSADEQYYVSLVQLIVTPERFDGKKVVVTGFLQLETEHSLLYLHEQDSLHGILENAIHVNANRQMRNDRETLNLKYVRVVGIFKASDRKRDRFNSGTITNIESCRFWSDPAHPMKERIKEMLG